MAKFRRSAGCAVVLCLGLVALEDFLFRGRPAGWTVGLYMLALSAALTWRGGRYLARWPGRIGALALLGLALACVEQPGPLAACLAIVTLVFLALVDRRARPQSALGWIERAGEFAWRMWIQIPRDWLLAGRWRRRGASVVEGAGVIGKWTAPIVLSLVFLGLFCLGNPIIAKWAGQLGDSVQRVYTTITAYVSPLRVLRWLLVAVAAWALLRTRTRERTAAGPPPRTLIDPEEWAWIDRFATPAMTIRCLILFNLLFGVQTVLDVIYLWGGMDLPDGITYAGYAHRGAYPLVATALLAGLFVLVTFRPGAATERMRSARTLVFLWIAQNILLASNAAWRLSLYVEAYTLTRLRLAAGIWMALVAVGLALIVWRIVTRRSNAWLVAANALMAGVTLYASCFINYDGMIASYNVRHGREIRGTGRDVDLDYLVGLSPEALPALEWLAENASGEPAAPHATRFARQMRDELADGLSDWRGWTWRRARLARE